MKISIKFIKFFLIFIIFTIFITNFIIISSTFYLIKKDIHTKNKYDLIVVLGASVYNNSPSTILQHRLDKAIYLYKNNISEKILMSGDNKDNYYNEVEVMKNYALSKGVKEKDILIDKYGLSTYDSIYRLKSLYNYDNIIISTQKYHLYRALYISKIFKINAIGIDATEKKLPNDFYRILRESLAITKDFFKTIIKPNSKYLYN